MPHRPSMLSGDAMITSIPLVLFILALGAAVAPADAPDAPMLEVPAGYPTQAPRPLPPVPAPRFDPHEKAALPAIDATPTPEELKSQHAQAASAAKDALHIGVFASLAEPLRTDKGGWSTGTWQAQPDGALAAATQIVSAGAQGIRVELAQLLLPPGGYAVLHGPQGDAFGPFDRIPPGSESLWTPSVAGDTAVLEVVLPPGANAEDARVEVRRIIHRFATIEKAAGNCNLDATCYPAWASTASAVGGLGVISDSGELFCTCALLNDTDPCTDTPLVLTANHCVRGASGTYGADNLEFYWSYSSTSCNGPVPSLLSVPRTTGGADYLGGRNGTGYTGGGNDFTLLRMRNDPPANLLRAGFSTALPPIGSAVAGIHHPRGDYKRITFGALTAVDNDFPALYHEVTWSQGTTEPGSSGSPLFRADTQQIIGQLWGGGASCTTPSAPDYYGRIDVTAQSTGQYLNPQRPVTFLHESYAGTEGSSVAIVLQLPAPAPEGDVSVQYTLTPQSAQPGFDYVPGGGTLTFAAGESQATVLIPLVDDTAWEPTEYFQLTLGNPGSCVQLGDVTTVTIAIQDNDLDSDGDQISDEDELSGVWGHVTNPFAWDSDGDGLDDLTEQRVYGTDPNNRDTDGDGYSDRTEINFNSDPLTPNFLDLPTFRIPFFTTR